VLRSSPVPRKIVTDQLRSYPVAKAEIPELVSVKHVFVKAAARRNPRAKNSHQSTRERERRMRGFRDPKRTQKFLACFGPIRQHFALKRHVITRLTLSQTTRRPVRCMARIHRTRPKSVDCLLTSRRIVPSHLR
jgi:transposase-like protein